MKILSIETSCDETAVTIIEAIGDFPNAEYKILGNSLFSQIDLHREYGGVFPNLAKREHIKTILPMMERALEEAGFLSPATRPAPEGSIEHLTELLNRETGLAEALIEFYKTHAVPEIDAIAVTSGPGLEPALWVGLNFAKALSYLFDIPLIPVNHMEGHVLASLFNGTKLYDIEFPAVALLISGGHTELILMRAWGSYELLGATRDDAVGEAFDKVARMMGLPYPGGPEISRLAHDAREHDLPQYTLLPRPMIDSPDLAFSFSGLKTAVRNAIQNVTLTDDEKAALARNFEDTVVEVLLQKTIKAVTQTAARGVVLGGGVTANRHIRESFQSLFNERYPDITLFLPETKLSTDNSIMIALAGHARLSEGLMPSENKSLRADGNRSLASK